MTATIHQIFQHPDFSDDYWSPTKEMIDSGLAFYSGRTPYQTAAGELNSYGLCAFDYVEAPPLPAEDIQLNQHILNKTIDEAEGAGFKHAKAIRQYFAKGTDCTKCADMLRLIHEVVSTIGEERIFEIMEAATNSFREGSDAPAL